MENINCAYHAVKEIIKGSKNEQKANANTLPISEQEHDSSGTNIIITKFNSDTSL